MVTQPFRQALPHRSSNRSSIRGTFVPQPFHNCNLRPYAVARAQSAEETARAAVELRVAAVTAQEDATAACDTATREAAASGAAVAEEAGLRAAAEASLAAGPGGSCLAHHPPHINLCLLSKTASHDVASNFCQALISGGARGA